ncbi:hypothetical protein GCM10011613_01600 [Cellvibrio zantedeschiae]|uniref:Uncharacterized protein n=1 Tax=Cellvibrio zantedeschiae TaxID=1237077 RepID=A0ABQ3AN12_9GAMM|nr:hypothetical protein [Cellvibrio zantedeschiae]GGY61836.1 hypothetical protein GCM10011613_01600 [Cellvibrio zantedeschiae]
MLDKMKDLGSQAANKATDALGGISSTIKDGVGSFSTAASSMTESLNEKAVRASTAQAYRILEIAIEELKDRPLSTNPISLTASINIGIAALEMQIHLPPQTGVSGERELIVVDIPQDETEK